MTDKEIIEHLKWLVLVGERIGSVTIGGGDVAVLLDLINRYEAEIERLQGYNENLQTANTALSNEILDIKSEAVEEFAKRLKKRKHSNSLDGRIVFFDVIEVDDIDAVKKEMMEAQK